MRVWGGFQPFFSIFIAASTAYADGVLKVPPGFEVTVWAEGLDRPRGLSRDSNGVLYACEMGAGRFVALIDEDGDGFVETKKVLVHGLDRAHSAVFHDGKLYIAETHRVAVFPKNAQGLSAAQGKTLIDLPAGGGHFTRTLAVSPGGRLFVSVGSTCNVCVERDERRAAVLSVDPETGAYEIFARGLRNAVGLAVHPETGKLWASCNGRDWLGDDLPPETFFIVEKGRHYGWPFAFFVDGKPVRDPDLGDLPGKVTGFPVFEYQAHSAPLGIEFYRGENFPRRFRHGIFVSLHGSWNRSRPVGYKVIFVPLKGGKPAGKPEDFLAGFLKGNRRLGRPVDLETGTDGSLFISDDYKGKIYRVRYKK